jgi:hypothetical protein
MHELDHSTDYTHLTRPQSRPPFAARGFVRATLAPIGLLALGLAAVAVAGRHWNLLPLIAGAAAVAVLLTWAMTTHAAARRGASIHSAANVAALVVIWSGIAVGLVMCGLAVFAPALLGLTPAGGVR